MDNATLSVGIDVANLALEAQFLSEEARPVRPPFTYPNDPPGWSALRTAIVATANLLGPSARVICGMEATSNMHKGIEAALRGETRKPLEVHVLNPRAVRHFAKARLKDSKTDRIDSQLIAEYLLRMRPKPQPALSPQLEQFRTATRMRRRLIEQRTDDKNQLHALMRSHLPGYHTIIGRAISKRLLAALARCPSPAAILAMPPQELAAIRTGNAHTLGLPFAEKLHRLAAQAPQATLESLTELLIRTTVARILQLEASIAELDQAIEKTLGDLFPEEPLSSIPGLGKVSVAAILAEVADVARFADKRRFIGYSGLYPIVWESGEVKQRFRMTFKGNRMLKTTFLIASAAARQYNPVIALYYERLRARGKSKKAAGGAIARKLAEIAFTLLVRGEKWSAEKATAGMLKAHSMSGIPAR